MSADNYFLIRKDGDQYAVEMRFASSDYADDEPISENAPRFPTLTAAYYYAYSEYSEYGVESAFPTEVVES